MRRNTLKSALRGECKTCGGQKREGKQHQPEQKIGHIDKCDTLKRNLGPKLTAVEIRLRRLEYAKPEKDGEGEGEINTRKNWRRLRTHKVASAMGMD